MQKILYLNPYYISYLPDDEQLLQPKVISTDYNFSDWVFGHSNSKHAQRLPHHIDASTKAI